MAKQSIYTLKEGSKYYIVIENPTKEVESKIESLFGNVVGDLSSILVPEQTADSKEIAQEIDSKFPETKSEPKEEPTPLFTDNEESIEGFEPNPSTENSEPEEEPKEEPKKESKSESKLTLEQAKEVVRRALEEEELGKGTFLRKKMLFFMFGNNPSMQERINKMPETECVKVWNENNMLEKAIQFSGYVKKKPTKEIEWV